MIILFVLLFYYFIFHCFIMLLLKRSFFSFLFCLPKCAEMCPSVALRYNMVFLTTTYILPMLAMAVSYIIIGEC